MVLGRRYAQLLKAGRRVEDRVCWWLLRCIQLRKGKTSSHYNPACCVRSPEWDWAGCLLEHGAGPGGDGVLSDCCSSC